MRILTPTMTASVFIVAILLSAWLLFVLQLMTAKMLLPIFGGAPAVWNTCMVFFQAALLAAYGYAHLASSRWEVRRHVPFHLLLMFVPILTLPMVAPLFAQDIDPDKPILRLLWVLFVMVGAPFFVSATTSPLLQRWFASSGHPRAHDPYFLYAASNVGSLLGLLGYVAIIEPRLTLAAQSRLWTAGYGLLTLLIVVCGVSVLFVTRKTDGEAQIEANPADEVRPIAASAAWRRTLSWIGLAFVPSSLMLAVTTYLSSEIAPAPMLWMAPLALYLLSFIIAFTRLPRWFDLGLFAILPLALAFEARLILGPIGNTPSMRLAVHLAPFFLIATACHCELARRRPPAGELTAYYLWVAVGGVLGGVFNAIVAPLVFDRFVEFPASLILAALLLPVPLKFRLWAWLGPASWAITLLPALLLALSIGEGMGLSLRTTFSVAAGLTLLAADRPARFATSLSLLLILGFDVTEHKDQVIHRSRNFFGMLTVRDDPADKTRRLLHGATDHGMQRRGPEANASQIPLLYYFPTGPIGQVFAAYRGISVTTRVGVVGLGVGSLACYAEPGDDYTFFEINPVVARLARDPSFFTHLRDCRAPVRIVVGDARQSLAREPAGRFGLLIVDAFSGDAIPIHLLTREALKLTRERLEPGGLIAIHVSNRYLDLEPVVAATAEAAGMFGLARFESHAEISFDEMARGKNASHWIVLASRSADLERLARLPRWRPVARRPGVDAWTDDYSDLWSARR